MLHENIVLYDSPMGGKGLVATALIRAGEVTWIAEPKGEGEGTRFSDDEISRWPPDRRSKFFRYAYQIGDTEWIGGNETEDISLLMNHSCDPNTWFVSDAEMVARRDIQPGEEITYDYATSETSAGGFDCRCGAASCRGRVTGNEFKEEWFQKRYQGHVLRYIAARIEHSNS